MSESAARGGAAGRDKHQAEATRVSQTREERFWQNAAALRGNFILPSIKAAPSQLRENVVSLHAKKKKKFNPLLQQQHVS